MNVTSDPREQAESPSLTLLFPTAPYLTVNDDLHLTRYPGH